MDGGCALRPTRPRDWRQTEVVVREAFWNTYQPGCCEHLLLHRLRQSSAYLPALDLVAVDRDGQIVGHIAYTRSQIAGAHGSTAVATFGPISVLPGWQRQGVGRALIRRTEALAAGMGYRGIVITGDDAIYSRLGYQVSKVFGIAMADGRYHAALLARELVPGGLSGVRGRFIQAPVFDQPIEPRQLQDFDAAFAPKKKAVTPTQQRYQQNLSRYLPDD